MVEQSKILRGLWGGLLAIIFLCTAAAAAVDTYPQLDISGYKKYEYKSVNVSPISNYYLAISQIGYSPTYSGGPWQEKLILAITGKLSENLSVGYDLEQQPESPDKYNVQVKYDNHKLTFGDINVDISGNEFASISKFVNGVMFTSKDSWYDLTLVPSAKGRSQSQGYTTQNGTGIRGPYNLGHGSILEGTERIELNGILLKRGADYTIDYFDGRVTFANIITSDDQFAYTYEFTNVLDLFFVSLSRTNFLGFQNRFTLDPREIGKKKEGPKPIIQASVEVFPTVFAEPADATSAEAASWEAVPLSETVEILPFVTSTPEGEDARQYYVVLDGDTFSGIIVNSKNKNYDYLWSKVRYRVADAELFYRIIADTLGVGSPDAIYAGQQLRVEQVTRPEIDRAQDYEFTVRDLQGRIAAGETVVPNGAEGATEEENPRRMQIEEEETIGQYQLAHSPLVKASEKIVFEGKILQQEIDYTIDYTTGKIVLLTPTLPSADNPLTVWHAYPVTSYESEVLDGTGGKGPYSLKFGQILDGSEKVVIDDVAATRDLDYTINYQTGELVFNFAISTASLIKVDYCHRVMLLPPVLPGRLETHKLTAGATYLREQSEKGTGAPTASLVQTISGSTIIGASNTIYLSYFPVVGSDEADFTVSLNGVALTAEVDYKIPVTTLDPATGFASVEPYAVLAYINDRTDLSSGHDTGTVKLLRTIESTDELTVVYTYKKSVVGRFSGAGAGSRGPYYLSNYRSVVPGSETLQVWQQGSSTLTTYTRNSSFEGNAGIYGYAINYYDGNPYITFNEILGTDYNYSVLFKYVAENSSTGQDLVKDVIGLDGSLKMGDLISIKGSVARSSADRVIAKEATTESFVGNSSRIYTLHAAGDIIDGSDVVRVNSYVLNRDVDYYINYSAPGQLVFYYVTPASSDAIYIEYEYESSGSAGEVLETVGTAYNVEGTSKIGDLFLSGDLKRVENNFIPMGSTSIGIGSERMDYKVAYTPSGGPTIYTSMRETADQISNYTNRFSRGYDRNTNLAWSGISWGSAAVTYRNFLTTDDVLPGAEVRNNDNLLESWDTGYTLPHLKFGDVTFDSDNDYKSTATRYDYIDRQNTSTRQSVYFRTNNVLKFTDRVSFTLDHQINEPLTTTATDESGTTQEVESAHTLARDTTYDLALNLTQWQLKKLTARLKLVNHEGIDFFNPSSEAGNTRNETYQLEFIPVPMLTTYFDHNRIETLAYVSGQANPKTQKTGANIALLPYSFLNLKWNGAWDDAFSQTGSHTLGNAGTYTLDFIPIAWSYLKLAARFTKYDRVALAPSGTYEVTTNTNSLAQDYTLTYIPFPALKIIPGFKQEDYINYDNNVASRVNTNTQNQTTKLVITYAPLPKLDIVSSYDLKVTRSLLDDINRHKSLIKAGAIYRVFSWGTLALDWSQEHNQGEIQAGSLVNLNLLKTIDQVSFTMNLPQSNPILSSVELKALYKYIDYVNYLSATDNFQANMLSFEGTLNF
ncbi:MAG: hypothetical protein WC901_06155 [Candidatus Margulisiibacteriota bacterium]